MSEETAKALAEAMNRLAAAIESLRSPGTMAGGIHVYHHGSPPHTGTPQYPYYPTTTWGPAYSYGGAT